MAGHDFSVQHKPKNAEFMNSWHSTSNYKILSHCQKSYLQFLAIPVREGVLRPGTRAHFRWINCAPGRVGQNHCSPGLGHGRCLLGPGRGGGTVRGHYVTFVCLYISLKVSIKKSFLKTTLLTLGQQCFLIPTCHSSDQYLTLVWHLYFSECVYLHLFSWSSWQSFSMKSHL